MTALVAHRPLQELSMSAIQAGSRRLSARLHEKENSQVQSHGGKGSASAARGKKRKNEYEEENDGFAFSRVKKNKKPRQSTDNSDRNGASIPIAPPVQNEGRRRPSIDSKPSTKQEAEARVANKDKRKKMSFSTPIREAQPVRRSKRLSAEHSERNSERNTSPALETGKVRSQKTAKDSKTREDLKHPAKQIQDVKSTQQIQAAPPKQQVPASTGALLNDNAPVEDSVANAVSDEHHSSTKISLPFADTPVIRRNKAMREGRGSKGDRRSSLGLRGRRASSLIETGNSNALPHKEVEITEFYKHIESDMMEPRRMRQLLTWCATRAMHPKSKGTDTNDSGPKSAARIIEEELLKELANKSELSDWFSREDAPAPTEPLPERPHPKNVQNAEKIAQLEQQIQRLRVEKDALEALLRPPELPSVEYMPTNSEPVETDQTLLSDEDAALLQSLSSSADLSSLISQRMTAVLSSIGPSIDTFADGVHQIAQYRNAADNTASRVLAICAERISEREREGRKKALHVTDERSPGRDLSNVLRGISKAER